MNSDMDRPGARHGRRFVATLASALLAATCALGTPGPARAGSVSDQVEARVATAGSRTVPVIITLRSDPPTSAVRGRAATLRHLRDSANRTQDEVLSRLEGPAKRFWLVNAIATDVDATELARLADDPEVLRVELDERVSVTGLRQVDGPPSSSWGIASVNAPQAWSSFGTTGSGVRIGSIDTGVDATNPELAGAIAGWRDFVGGQPTPYDDHGHGTHTIGTMVARNVNGARIGVAPGATVIVAKAIGANGTASGSALLEAAQWMTDPDGDPSTADSPTVINNSWTAAGWDNEWFRPMVQAWVALGILPVFGVGNTAGTVGNPASYPESLTVGAVDELGKVAANSSNGVVTWSVNGTPTQFSKPDITAPGVGISSTVGSGYGYYSGSSMAAPHVAAAAALIRQARPELGVDAIREALRAGATDRGPVGPDLAYGAGTLNIAASLAAVGVAGTVAAEPPATTVTTLAVRSPTRVSLLRVVRSGKRLVVRGRVNGPARLRLTVRPAGKRQNETIAVATSVASRAGSFVVRSKPNAVRGGRYVVVVTAVDPSGRRLASASRVVRLR